MTGRTAHAAPDIGVAGALARAPALPAQARQAMPLPTPVDRFYGRPRVRIDAAEAQGRSHRRTAIRRDGMDGRADAIVAIYRPENWPARRLSNEVTR